MWHARMIDDLQPKGLLNSHGMLHLAQWKMQGSLFVPPEKQSLTAYLFEATISTATG